MDTPKAHILVLDDNKDIQAALTEALGSQNYVLSNFLSSIEALENLKKGEGQPVDLIISDVRLPEMDGLTFVSKVKEILPDTPIILMTAYGNLDIAVKAIRLGAFDFLRKPFDLNEMLISVERALSHSKLVLENRALSEELSDKWKLDQIIGKSKKMQDVFDLVKRVSRTSANVLITGESGTGKEVIAHAIHENSLQADKPFIAINCAAIPEELLESELFGHSKGSFTGAHQSRHGLFQEADGGTLFLDEIGDMSVGLQAKLLRVLQDKKVRPVGDNNYYQVNVRILAATNRDLRQSIKNGKFREDLFFRLNVISLDVPPLRERKEDIVLLAQHFLNKFSAIHRSTTKRFSKGALAVLIEREWQGNVRELENAVERAVVLSEGSEISEKDFSKQEQSRENGLAAPQSNELLSLKDIEMKYIAFILKKTGGKKEKASRILNIDRTTLYRKLIDFGLDNSTKLEETQHQNLFN